MGEHEAKETAQREKDPGAEQGTRSESADKRLEIRALRHETELCGIAGQLVAQRLADIIAVAHILPVALILQLAGHKNFLHAFGFTAAFTVVSTVLINVCAFAIALVLTRGIRGTNIFRTVYFMPNLIGGILLGYIWQILLNGVLANLQKPLLALDAKAGFVGLVILMCWQQIGYMMIIYVAGLQSVPGDLIEAAKIDGASDREILFKIKLPMVMPSITICTFLTLTNSFKLFDQNVALTAGEPANASEMLALNIYNTFYGRSGAQWKGIGQAKAVVFFLIVVVISLAQLHFTRSKEVQQ